MMSWVHEQKIASKSYTCGYCGNSLVSNRGYSGGSFGSIYICHYCSKPTFILHDGNQFPGSPFGREVKEIPATEVSDLYREARECIQVNANTASILCSRKLLMNIAVSKGASEGKSFVEYVDYLNDNGFLPPDSKDWVDHIRKTGNVATHKIKIMKREEAEELVTFIEMLLKFIYEFPAMMKAKAKPSTTPTD
jgi:uncharacterized protein DUF4145